MRRRQLVRAAVNAARIGHVAEGEILLHRQRVDVAHKAGVRRQHFQLRAKDEAAIGQPRVVQRFDAHAVARQKQRLLAAVPQRKGKHPAQALHAGGAPRLPRVDDDFGIAAGFEGVAQRLQLSHQGAVVVDLAVKDDAHRALGIEQRLLPGRQVNHRQAPVPQRQTRLQIHAVFVRAPVGLDVVDALRQRRRKTARAQRVKQARDAAHGQSCPCARVCVCVCCSAATNASPWLLRYACRRKAASASGSSALRSGV